MDAERREKTLKEQELKSVRERVTQIEAQQVRVNKSNIIEHICLKLNFSRIYN